MKHRITLNIIFTLSLNSLVHDHKHIPIRQHKVSTHSKRYDIVPRSIEFSLRNLLHNVILHFILTLFADGIIVINYVEDPNLLLESQVV